MKISHECLDALVDEKFSQSEIAKVCGCSRQAVNARIPGHVPYSRIPCSNKNEYKVFWARIWGLSYEQIAENLSLPRSMVIRYINLNKECLFGYKHLCGPKLNIKALSWETRVYWFRIQGLSWVEIAKRLNIKISRFNFFVKNNPEIKIKAVEKEVWQATLKKVFKYGDATTTHLNILNLLNALGVPKEEYTKWNKSKEEENNA